MNEERIMYRVVGREIWQGTQVKVKNGWWHKPDFELLRVCKDAEEAEAMLKELKRTFKRRKSGEQ